MNFIVRLFLVKSRVSSLDLLGMHLKMRNISMYYRIVRNALDEK
ncbi:hypothetical protein PYH72_01510 [Staphylococcus delphini]